MSSLFPSFYIILLLVLCVRSSATETITSTNASCPVLLPDPPQGSHPYGITVRIETNNLISPIDCAGVIIARNWILTWRKCAPHNTQTFTVSSILTGEEESEVSGNDVYSRDDSIAENFGNNGSSDLALVSVNGLGGKRASVDIEGLQSGSSTGDKQKVRLVGWDSFVDYEVEVCKDPRTDDGEEGLCPAGSAGEARGSCALQEAGGGVVRVEQSGEISLVGLLDTFTPPGESATIQYIEPLERHTAWISNVIGEDVRALPRLSSDGEDGSTSVAITISIIAGLIAGITVITSVIVCFTRRRRRANGIVPVFVEEGIGDDEILSPIVHETPAGTFDVIELERQKEALASFQQAHDRRRETELGH